MEDSPEDLPKPPRRTAARPFFSPRPEGSDRPARAEPAPRRAAVHASRLVGRDSDRRQASGRRAGRRHRGGARAHLQCGRRLDRDERQCIARFDRDVSDDYSASASELAVESDLDGNVEHDVDFDGDWTPRPLVEPEHTLDAESLLRARISPTTIACASSSSSTRTSSSRPAASSVPDEHAIEVIALRRCEQSAAGRSDRDGETPKVDGLRLESTEFSFEQAAPPPTHERRQLLGERAVRRKCRMPNTGGRRRRRQADETEATIDEETAGEDGSELAIERFGTDLDRRAAIRVGG